MVRWAGRLVIACAVTVIAISAARMVWIIAIGPDAYVRVPVSVAASASAQSANLDFSILSRVTPFRTSAAAPDVATRAPIDESAAFSDVAETTLDLKLHGLISEDEDGGHAFISTNGGAQTAYAVGDEIDGTRGVTLERLLVDSVLLRRNGVLESLTYDTEQGAITTLSAVDTLDPDAIEETPEKSETAPPAATRAIAPVDETGTVQAPTTSAPSPSGSEGASARGTASPQADAAAATPSGPVIIRRMTRSDLETMAVSIRLEENQASEAGGLYIFPTGNIDVFAKSGLQAGDIILEVAGLKLDNRADFDRLLQEVEAQRQINLVISRGQVVRELRVTIID